MKLETDGNTVRIKGDVGGNERHLKIFCGQMNGDDYFAISVIKDGIEIGCGPSYFINKNHVIQSNRGVKEFI